MPTPNVTQEEENYLRMHLLLTGISPRAVQVLFDKEFHPSSLSASIKKEFKKLNDMKKKHVINAEQWKLLFPLGGRYSILQITTLKLPVYNFEYFF